MTNPPTPHSLSDRPSGRVEYDQAAAAEFSALPPNRRAESMASGAGPRASAAERRGRVTEQRFKLIERELTARDHAILRDVHAYHFLQTSQIVALYFQDHATPEAAARACRRTLKRLSAGRLIDPLERRIGGVRAGSAGFVWRLGPAGERLLRETHPDVRARGREPSVRFLDHMLAVADCYLTVTTLSHREQLELLDSAPEPASWRAYLGVGGSRETLKPDLALATAQGDYEDRWFVEVDRATESLPTILKQCLQYERYRRTGTEQSAHGVFPVVVWVAPDDQRAAQIEDAIRGSRDLDRSLYRVTTMAGLAAVLIGGSA